MDYEKTYGHLGVVFGIGFVVCVIFPRWGFVIIAATVLVIIGISLCEYEADHRAKQRRGRKAIALRADRQHAAILRGDPYGLYGEYPPVKPPPPPVDEDRYERHGVIIWERDEAAAERHAYLRRQITYFPGG